MSTTVTFFIHGSWENTRGGGASVSIGTTPRSCHSRMESWNPSMKALSRAVIHKFFSLKVLLDRPLSVVRSSNPMLSDSSIRRLMRQRNLPQRCRNQVAGLDGPKDSARLALRGRHRFPIGFSFLKHPKSCFREVACHSHLGLIVPAPCSQSLIKPADMVIATTLPIKHRTVGRLHKCPLKVAVHITTYRSEVELTPTGVLARNQPAVAGELLGTG